MPETLPEPPEGSTSVADFAAAHPIAPTLEHEPTPVLPGNPVESSSASEPVTLAETHSEIDYGSAFTGYNDDETAALLDLVALIRDDPSVASEVLATLAKDLAPQEQEALVAAVASATTPNPTEELSSLNGQPEDIRAQFESWYAEKEAVRQQEVALDAAAREVNDYIDGLGYGRNTPDRAALYVLANDKFNGDIDKAHAEVQAWKQQVFNELVAQQAGTNAGFPAQEGSTGQGVATGVAGAPATFAEAAERHRAALRSGG